MSKTTYTLDISTELSNGDVIFVFTATLRRGNKIAKFEGLTAVKMGFSDEKPFRTYISDAVVVACDYVDRVVEEIDSEHFNILNRKQIEEVRKQFGVVIE